MSRRTIPTATKTRTATRTARKRDGNFSVHLAITSTAWSLTILHGGHAFCMGDDSSLTESMLSQATALLRARDFASAERLFCEVLDRTRSNAEAFAGLALVLYQT